MGESGGGGMSVPAVRESSGARTGSSKRPREMVGALGALVGMADGIFLVLCQ
jgi:hypothetical protein